MNESSYDEWALNNISGIPFVFNTSLNATYSERVHATDEWFFYISLAVSIVAAAVLAFLVIWFYTFQSRKYVSFFLYIPLYLNYTLLFTAVSLITLDVSIALSSPGVLPDESLVYCWNIIYWSLQILSWIILPILQSYAYTGEFSFIGKILRAILSNIVTYLIMGLVAGACIVVFVIYLAIRDVSLLTFSFLVSVAVSLSNFAGLVLLSLFLGYGIVKAPRTLWRKTNIERTIKWNCIEAPEKRAKLKKEERALVEMIVVVKEVSKIVDSQHKFIWYLNQMTQTCDRILQEFPSLNKKVNSLHIIECSDYNKQTFDKFLDVGSQMRICPEQSKNKTCTRSTCVKMHSEIQRASREYRSKKYEWDQKLKETFYYQDVIRCCTYPSNHPFHQKTIISEFSTHGPIVNRFLYYYYRYIHWLFLKTVALLLGVFGLIILWSELTPTIAMLVDERGSSIFFEIIDRLRGNRAATQIVSLTMIVCISFLMLAGMFKTKLWTIFKMIPYNTDTYSLYFSASLICRAVPSLCYNFLQLIEIKSDDGVAFFYVVGILDFDILQPGLGFVTQILKHFPMIIIVVAFLCLLRVPERIANFKRLRWKVFAFKQYSNEQLEEGTRLMKRKRKSILKKLNSQQTTKEKNDLKAFMYSIFHIQTSSKQENPLIQVSQTSETSFEEMEYLKLD
ncbi:hypothetical protein C9374_003267 [Naegleria lovaniensis]|uniref:Uncharacterized protein n=1 Tax=Naegleria lovaniensis TaxID=51637 RepID=A0AA88KPI1_NAELO|nr:uncharacterized protein C9374_003267 [Naegleria lovaniensis]KAG2385452.1 hypothetical protein C9374_003267 [Naegleria lovaniensis]